MRNLLAATSREGALRKAGRRLDAYLQLAAALPAGAGKIQVGVPPMPGIDVEMRQWSFFMILEHNAIVNRSITATVVQLVRGEPLSGAAAIDPKRGVLPSAAADEQQIAAFADSVAAHTAALRNLGRLRGTARAPHPVFGPFDAHKWHAMFALHLGLHLPQARYVARHAR